MSNISGTAQLVCPSYINVAAGAGPPPPLTGVLSTQFNASFSSPTTPGLGMLNLIIFG